MNITLNSAIVRPNVTEAKLLRAAVKLNESLVPIELELLMDIGGEEKMVSLTDATEIAQILSVSLAGSYAAELAGKIDSKGNIV